MLCLFNYWSAFGLLCKCGLWVFTGVFHFFVRLVIDCALADTDAHTGAHKHTHTHTHTFFYHRNEEFKY